MTQEDISDAIATTACWLKILGWNWDHPRIQAWIERCGFTSYRDLNPRAYEALAKKLEQIYLTQKQNSSATEPITCDRDRPDLSVL